MKTAYNYNTNTFVANLTFDFCCENPYNEILYHYFGARYYDSDLSIWLSVDPLAGKYPNLSPYVYCANNPINMVDPNGMEIDWGNMSRKEIRYAKSALRQNIGSKTYREMMRTLRKSDYVYTVNNSTIALALGDFLGNYGHRIEIPSEDGNSSGFIEILSGRPGGRIGINFDMVSTDLSKDNFNEYMGTAMLEEFIHAAQYDYYVHQFGQIDGTNAMFNNEFEAKVIVGMIQGQINKNFSVQSIDITPNNYGRNSNEKFSINSYFSTMNKWRLENNNPYRNKFMNSNNPNLLMNYLRK